MKTRDIPKKTSVAFDILLERGSGAPPHTFGVYEFWDERDTRIYVGKAISLKLRLAQYRRASRGKRAKKMRQIRTAAFRITWTICTSELDALEKELLLIQTHRPRFNVVGAFSFLYPYIGFGERLDKGVVEFCFTTMTEQTRAFQLWGAFRSRSLTLAAFESLTELLGYLGHRVRRKVGDRTGDTPYSIYACYRQLTPDLLTLVRRILAGEREALTELTCLLLEKSHARRDAAQIQDWLQTIEEFLAAEVVPLLRIVEAQQLTLPISQTSRDLLFLRERVKDAVTTY